MNVMQRTLLLQREAEQRRREAHQEARSKALDARDRELEARAKALAAPASQTWEFSELRQVLSFGRFYECISLDDSKKVADVYRPGSVWHSARMLAPEEVAIDECLKLLRAELHIDSDAKNERPLMLYWEISSNSGAEMHIAQVINRIRFRYPRCRFLDPAGVEIRRE